MGGSLCVHGCRWAGGRGCGRGCGVAQSTVQLGLPEHAQLGRTLLQSGVNAQRGPLILTPLCSLFPADDKHLWMANHRWILTGTPINASGALRALCALSQLAEHHQAAQLQAARKAPCAALAACTQQLHSVSALVHSTYPPHPTYPSIHLTPTPPPPHTHTHAPPPKKTPPPPPNSHKNTHTFPPPAVDTIGPSLDFLRLGGGYTDAYRHLPPLMAHVLQVGGNALWMVGGCGLLRGICV